LYPLCRVLRSHNSTADGAVPWRSKLVSCWAPVQDGDEHGTTSKRANDETRERASAGPFETLPSGVAVGAGNKWGPEPSVYPQRQLNRRPRCSGKIKIEDREMREDRRRGKMKGPRRMRVEVGRLGNAGWAACFGPRPCAVSATAYFVPGVRLLRSLANVGQWIGCLWWHWQVERPGRQTDWKCGQFGW
jgi:hypothetical protein